MNDKSLDSSQFENSYKQQIKSVSENRTTAFCHVDFSVLNYKILTLSQTTNLRLFQTERVCRRQFQVW